MTIEAATLRALEGRLRSALPEDVIVSDRDARKTYECDGLTAYREMP